MVTENMGNRRSACDRCRRHKLRCERGHAVQCRRCEKINAECLTSPALRSGRPQQLSGADDPDIQSFNGPFNGYEELPSVISTLDVSLLPLASPPEINISESDSALPQLISPTNLDDFSHFWPQNFGQNLALAAVPGTVPVTPPSETQGDCLRKLGDLQAAVIGDLENVKSCITADKCPEALDSSDLNPVTSQNIMIGRMLDHSTSLIDILNHFQPHANSAPFELTCDTPTMFVLLSCYIGLILVQISEDMLGKIESRFGLVDNIFQPTGVVLTQGKAARMLSTMLEEEANEQPPLYQPRGHCDSLRSILDRLKNSV
ncbi:unnamed protein product [Penicillium manginii]